MDFREALLAEMQKSKTKLTENKKVQEAKVEEDTEEYLEPRFDSRASFYKKAKVVKKDNGDEELYSYGTHVGGTRNGKPYSKGKWSQTTSRHQAEYFRQKGYDPKEVEIEEGKKLQEEVSDEAYEIAEEIANKIKAAGVMHFTEVDDLIAKLYGKEDIEDIKNDVYGCLNYKGIDQNFSTGDFFTQSYAESNPEVKEESKKLEERAKDYDALLDVVDHNIIPELEFIIENGSDAGLDGLVALCEDFKSMLAHGLGELGYYDKEKKEEILDIKPNVNIDMQDSNLLSGNTTSTNLELPLPLPV